MERYLTHEIDRCYATLGVAVVKQSLLDWRKAKMDIAHCHRVAEARQDIKDVEKFLASPLPEFYSGLDGTTLLRKMREGIL